MLQPQKVEAIYENGVLHPLEPLEGFAEHCKVKITVDYEEMPPHPLARFVGILSGEEAQELRRIIENLERELMTLKKFIETPEERAVAVSPAKRQASVNSLPRLEETQKIKNETQIRDLRKQLLDEGCDEELVQLVGTIPKRRDNYKEEIRTVIYERAQRNHTWGNSECEIRNAELFF